MYKLVSSPSDLEEAAEDIRSERLGCGLDTETYGTDFLDRMFALQIATANHVWYFNFHDYGTGVPVLDRASTLAALVSLRSDMAVWFIHNAKFDLRRLALEGHKVEGAVHCTQMCERFIYNQHQRYSLSACLERRGLTKDDAVAAYIQEHKLWEKGNTSKKYFEKVPFEIMFNYGCMDAENVRKLGIDQREQLNTHAFYHNDTELQKVCYDMEEIGMVVRTDYANKGLEYERNQAAEVVGQLSTLAGEPFRNGPKWLRGIFDRHGVPYRTNPKTNNPIFDKHALDEIDHPIAGLIRQYRKHEQYAGTYYEVYAKSDVVHAQIKLHGTDTGRFSYAEPNLQNVPKEETLDDSVPVQVRGCFTPRSPDHCFVMVDFNQQEFRLMLDYAGESALIKRINDHGEDVHQATADLVGVSRKQAKTINFGLLYGMGVEKLAKQLGVSSAEAKAIRSQYFAKLPNVQRLIRAIIEKGERQGFITTWVGRRLFTPSPWRDPDTKALVRFEYVLPNHLIQAGCADIARFAMVEIAQLLKPLPQTNMLLQVHDELLFEVHKNDLSIIPDIVKIMENTYRPFNGMKMTCGVDWSPVSWGKRNVYAGYPRVENGEWLTSL